MKRIAVVSDIHGNLPALEAVIADIARFSPEAIVNLGDLLSGPLWPAETADRLMPLGWPTIAGNHERQLLTTAPERMAESDRYAADRLDDRRRAWLASLPPGLRLSEEVLMVHGTPSSDLVYWLETVMPDFGVNGSPGIRPATAEEVKDRLGGAGAVAGSPRLILCGHTHVPRMALCGGTLVVNPGSVGLQAYDDAHPFPHWVENGSPQARWALVERTQAGWQASFHAVAYDWEAAARQAERAGRTGWAHALRTGRFSAGVQPT